MEEKKVYPWKQELAELKAMLKAENERHTAAVKDINEKAKKVIDLAGSDAWQAWEEWYEKGASIWFKIKEWLHWSDYWAYECAAALILGGMFIYYVLGLR